MFWERTRPSARMSTYGSQFDLLDRFFGTPGRRAGSAYPAFNVWADENGAVVTSELPGVTLQDLEITVSGRNIGIRGTRSEEEPGENRRSTRRERPAGAFERTIQMGFQIDAEKVEAKLANGVLEISLPRAENDKPRKIAVSGD